MTGKGNGGDKEGDIDVLAEGSKKGLANAKSREKSLKFYLSETIIEAYSHEFESGVFPRNRQIL